MLPAPAIGRLIEELVQRGISGGATYDALIGATAKAAGATLQMCDRRAGLVYERLDVEVRFGG